VLSKTDGTGQGAAQCALPYGLDQRQHAAHDGDQQQPSEQTIRSYECSDCSEQLHVSTTQQPQRKRQQRNQQRESSAQDAFEQWPPPHRPAQQQRRDRSRDRHHVRYPSLSYVEPASGPEQRQERYGREGGHQTCDLAREAGGAGFRVRLAPRLSFRAVVTRQ